MGPGRGVHRSTSPKGRRPVAQQAAPPRAPRARRGQVASISERLHPAFMPPRGVPYLTAFQSQTEKGCVRPHFQGCAGASSWLFQDIPWDTSPLLSHSESSR